MTATKPKGQPRRVVKPGEENLMRQAQQLQQAGDTAFTNPAVVGKDGKFDLEADIDQMIQTGLVPPEVVKEMAMAKEAKPQEDNPQQGPPVSSGPPVSPGPPTAPQAEAVVPTPPAPEAPAPPLGEDLPEDPNEKLQKVADLLATLSPDAPAVEHLATWKQTYGSVFVLRLEDRAFVYRYLNRQEWIQLMSSESFNSLASHLQEEQIFDRCVLWPRYDQMAKYYLPAGTMSLMVDQIRIQSMFLDPASVAQLAVRL
jgi:hypothetical protein